MDYGMNLKILSCIRNHVYKVMNEMTLLLLQLEFNLGVPRVNFGMTVQEDWITVAGGFNADGHTVSASCEKLKLTTGERDTFPSMSKGKMYCQLFRNE